MQAGLCSKGAGDCRGKAMRMAVHFPAMLFLDVPATVRDPLT